MAKAQSLGIENKIIDNDFYNEFIEIKIISIMPQHAIHKVWDVSCSSWFCSQLVLSGFFDKFVHSFWISNALSLALLSNIVLYYNYPKGWQINRRKKG